MRRQLLTLSFVAVLSAMSFVVVQTALGGPGSRPRAQDVDKAERDVPAKEGTQDFRVTLPSPGHIGGNGVVEPRGEEVALAAPMPGKIALKHVKEGDKVKAGQVLIELENSTEWAAFQAAQAEVAVAEADALGIRRGGKASDVSASQADAEAALARAELSKISFERIERLAKEGAATGDELDKAQRTYQADVLVAKAAGSRISSVQHSRREDVVAGQARVAAARARREQAAAALEKLRVKSPIDGEVLQAKFDVGEYYSPSGGDALVVLGNTSVLQVRMDVEERDIGALAVGSKAFAMADAWPDRKFTGRVVELGHRMGRRNVRTDDPTERTDTKILEVVIELDQANAGSSSDLVPGLRVMSYIERK